jgi:hypothetical protein
MPIDVFASGVQEPPERSGEISRFKEGQHVVVKWKAGARLACPGGSSNETIPAPGVAHGTVTKIGAGPPTAGVPTAGVPTAGVPTAGVPTAGVEVMINEGPCRGLSIYIDVLEEDLRSADCCPQDCCPQDRSPQDRSPQVLRSADHSPHGVLPNTDLGVLTWLLERSSLVPAEAGILPDLVRQGLIPKSFDETLDRIFGAVKKARIHDHTLRNPTVTDIEPAELLVAVDIAKGDLRIHPDAWVFSQGNGRFDVHIEPGLYYTFYT